MRLPLLSAVFALVVTSLAHAASADEITASSRAALSSLLQSNATAQALSEQAVAVLVFPSVDKAGFIVAGQFGEGALFENGRVTAYYSTLAASVGYQAGAERYGYALFFLNQDSLDFLKKSKGWSLGGGPSLVIVDKGFAKDLSTATAKKNVYACVFNQQGLMGGIGIEGAKITRIHPD